MKKKTKSMKIAGTILGMCACLAIAMPVSAVDASMGASGTTGALGGMQYNMPSAQDLQLMQQQSGMNYRHEEDVMRRQMMQGDVNRQYQEYSEYGRAGNPKSQDVVNEYQPDNG